MTSFFEGVAKTMVERGGGGGAVGEMLVGGLGGRLREAGIAILVLD